MHKSEDFDENFEDSLSFVTVERNKLVFYSNLLHEGDPYIMKVTRIYALII